MLMNAYECNYIEHWESYEGYESSYEITRNHLNMRDGITKEIL
jgi:hypothetical protein